MPGDVDADAVRIAIRCRRARRMWRTTALMTMAVAVVVCLAPLVFAASKPGASPSNTEVPADPFV
jgi:hypothetical protein